LFHATSFLHRFNCYGNQNGNSWDEGGKDRNLKWIKDDNDSKFDDIGMVTCQAYETVKLK